MFGFLIGVVVGVTGFMIARNFVVNRLRFVDAIKSPLAPVFAGLAAALITWPLSVLPLITVGTSAVFGLGAGFGTASGVKALKRGDA